MGDTEPPTGMAGQESQTDVLDHGAPEPLRAAFAHHFGSAPLWVASAPGRVNIIGEHTDYNGGYVLPMAIARRTFILAAPRDDRVVRAHAAAFEAEAAVSLDALERNPEAPWLDYVTGVLAELDTLGHPLTGADLYIAGSVPIGAGLSSSASLEMATLALFEAMTGVELPGPAGAELGQRVENGFLGVNSGIMDQFIVRMGQKDHALFLDCESLDFHHVPVAFQGALFVIADTGARRDLAASEYNRRAAECQEAVEILRAALEKPGAEKLRAFTPEELRRCEDRMPETVFRRARHVVTENQRTLEASNALAAGDPVTLGALMSASDASLRNDYAVTSPELDAMTSLARKLPGCYGARMTGAGFGGCTVHLVDEVNAEDFGRELLQRYQRETGREGAIYISAPAAGALACQLG